MKLHNRNNPNMYCASKCFWFLAHIELKRQSHFKTFDDFLTGYKQSWLSVYRLLVISYYYYYSRIAAPAFICCYQCCYYYSLFSYSCYYHYSSLQLFSYYLSWSCLLYDAILWWFDRKKLSPGHIISDYLQTDDSLWNMNYAVLLALLPC